MLRGRKGDCICFWVWILCLTRFSRFSWQVMSWEYLFLRQSELLDRNLSSFGVFIGIHFCAISWLNAIDVLAPFLLTWSLLLIWSLHRSVIGAMSEGELPGLTIKKAG